MIRPTIRYLVSRRVWWESNGELLKEGSVPIHELLIALHTTQPLLHVILPGRFSPRMPRIVNTKTDVPLSPFRMFPIMDLHVTDSPAELIVALQLLYPASQIEAVVPHDLGETVAGGEATQLRIRPVANFVPGETAEGFRFVLQVQKTFVYGGFETFAPVIARRIRLQRDEGSQVGRLYGGVQCGPPDLIVVGLIEMVHQQLLQIQEAGSYDKGGECDKNRQNESRKPFQPHTPPSGRGSPPLPGRSPFRGGFHCKVSILNSCQVIPNFFDIVAGLLKRRYSAIFSNATGS